MIRIVFEAECLKGNYQLASWDDKVVCTFCKKGIGEHATIKIVQDLKNEGLQTMPQLNLILRTMVVHKRCWEDPQYNPEVYFG